MSRLRAFALFSVILLILPFVSGCVMIDRLRGIDDSAFPSAAGNGTGPTSSSNQRANYSAKAVWKLGYTWTWIDVDGATITDIVSEIVSTNRSQFYRVDSYDQYAPDLHPVKKAHVYDAATLALVRSQDERGFVQYRPSNVPLGLSEGFRAMEMSYRLTGKDPVPAIRVGLLYDLGKKSVSVPAGTFDAREIRVFVNETQNAKRFPHEFTHWWSDEVKNDVAFERSGRLYRLLRFSVEETPNRAPPRAVEVPPESGAWKVGYAWTWASTNGSVRFSQTVLDETHVGGKSAFKVRESYEDPRTGRKSSSIAWYDAATLARLNVTQSDGKVSIDFVPSESPHRPSAAAEFAYTENGKFTRSAWTNEYLMKITPAGRENMTTYAGTFTAFRYDWTGSRANRENAQDTSTVQFTRWWSPEIANNVAFSTGWEDRWELQQFRLGEVRKWDRDW